MGIFFYRDWIVLFWADPTVFLSFSLIPFRLITIPKMMERVTGYKATGVANVRMSIRLARQPNPALGDVSIAHCWFIFLVAFGPNRTSDFKRVLSNQFALGGRRPASKRLRVTSARVHVKELPFSCFLYIFPNWSCVIFQGRRLSHSRNRHLFGSLNLRISSMPDRESVTSIRRKTNNERQADGKCEITTQSAVVIRQSG